MKVRHARLHDVNGRPARHGGFTIVPANVELEGIAFHPSFALDELPADDLPPVLREAIEHHFDVAWVRARLPAVFGCAPDPSEREKTLLLQGFVAVRDGADEALAFECSDHYGRTSLTFSEAEGDEQLKADVADAFWSVLLAEPDALADFSARCYHVGAGVWLNYGCADGEPYCLESDGDEGE